MRPENYRKKAFFLSSKDANLRSELGHLEMDTIVSCSGGSGGLVVFVDRLSRYYYLEYISQDCVIRAIRKMFKDKRFGLIRSVTTDNGTEFFDQDKLQKVLGCKVHYTWAYASYEKGSIENVNKMVRKQTQRKLVFFGVLVSKRH